MIREDIVRIAIKIMPAKKLSNIFEIGKEIKVPIVPPRPGKIKSIRPSPDRKKSTAPKSWVMAKFLWIERRKATPSIVKISGIIK